MPEDKEIEARLINLERKVDQMKEEVMQQLHLITENIISQVKLVAEGVMNF